ncbi:MAG TPA: hypothetical protein VH325_15385 [Bryobacteraceae bacterium]|jgi:hypothetical protein|nr:hypothetical protein [Bryobacteraceae bacterium]
MEPLNDRELDHLLTNWTAPPAPATLSRRVDHARRKPWWNWLLTGSIRLPVPLALAFAVLVIVIFVATVTRGPAKPLPHPSTPTAFQPVKRLEPRIIRSTYENSH